MAAHNAKPQDDNNEGNINVSVGGNVSGSINAAKRDLHIVQGDQITVGNITGSTGVAIGKASKATVTQSVDPEVMKQIFAQILDRLDTLQGHDKDDIADAQETVREIQEKVLAEGEKVEEAWLAKRFRNIARMGPDILDVVTAALVNPAAGVAMTVKKIAEKAREDSGLESVS
jgi:hypothetical protein